MAKATAIRIVVSYETIVSECCYRLHYYWSTALYPGVIYASQTAGWHLDKLMKGSVTEDRVGSGTGEDQAQFRTHMDPPVTISEISF